MTETTVRSLEMFVRVVGFFTKNPIVFGKGSLGPMLVAQFKRVVEDVRGLIVKHSSSIAAARGNSGKRRAARLALFDALDSISRSAAGIAVSKPGFADSFRMVRNVNDSELLISAHRFAENVAPFRSDFVRFEMATTFVDDLNSKIKDFEQAMSDHSISRSEHVATNGLIDTEIKNALAILAQLDPIMSNKLADAPDLKAQWENVRHIEHAWVSKKAEPKPAPAVVPPAEAA